MWIECALSFHLSHITKKAMGKGWLPAFSLRTFHGWMCMAPVALRPPSYKWNCTTVILVYWLTPCCMIVVAGKAFVYAGCGLILCFYGPNSLFCLQIRLQKLFWSTMDKPPVGLEWGVSFMCNPTFCHILLGQNPNKIGFCPGSDICSVRQKKEKEKTFFRPVNSCFHCNAIHTFPFEVCTQQEVFFSCCLKLTGMKYGSGVCRLGSYENCVISYSTRIANMGVWILKFLL